MFEKLRLLVKFLLAMFVALVLTFDVYRLLMQQGTILPWFSFTQYIPRQTIGALIVGLDFIAVTVSLSFLLQLIIRPPDIDKLQIALADLTRKNEQLKKEKEELDKEVSYLKSLNENLQAENRKLMINLEGLHKELEKYTGQLNDLSARLEFQKQTLQQLEMNLHACQESLQVSPDVIDELKRTLIQDVLNPRLDNTFALLLIREANRYEKEGKTLASKILLETANRILQSPEYKRRAKILWEVGERTDKSLQSEI
jgi:septal ring factor EnvC (AmiA/AmiB activator)